MQSSLKTIREALQDPSREVPLPEVLAFPRSKALGQVEPQLDLRSNTWRLVNQTTGYTSL